MTFWATDEYSIIAVTSGFEKTETSYTGIAYIEVMQLTPGTIFRGTDRNRCIKTVREKTGTFVKK